MKRKINHWECKVEDLQTDGFAADPAGWFAGRSDNCRNALFLAHADDGVIWGRLQDNRLVTSSQLFKKFQVSPPLRAVTLQQACLFNDVEEVRVWRKEDGFQACRLYDVLNEEFDSFDEEQVLWGTRAEDRENEFTLLADGRQGLRHAVPLNVPASSFDGKSLYRPLRLLLRHYLVKDSDGCVRVYLSRLLGLWHKPRGKKGEIKR